MTGQPAPVRSVGESAAAYIIRVCEYMSEPERRRMGVETANAMRAATRELAKPSVIRRVGYRFVLAAKALR